MKWTLDKALNRVMNKCTIKAYGLKDIIVLNGTAGNRTLGAIDYLNHYHKFNISIMHEKQFNRIR